MKKKASPIMGLTLVMLSGSICAAIQEKPDFGPSGLAGLSEVKIWRLSRGEVVLPQSLTRAEEGKTLIEAALVFGRSPEEVWRLLSKTEDQDRYLSEVKKVIVISRTSAEDLLEFTVKVLIKTLVYRVRYHYYQEDLFFRWELDPSFPSDVKELSGFWRLYPFAEGKTLARYGSKVALGFGIPRSIQDSLAKNRLPDALKSVQRYIDSGGTWDKTQRQRNP